MIINHSGILIHNSSKKTGNYHIYTKGTIHYKMKTRLSIYQYNSAFNVSVSTNCEVANS